MTDFWSSCWLNCRSRGTRVILVMLVAPMVACATTAALEDSRDDPASDDANAQIAAAVPSTDIVLVELPAFLEGKALPRVVPVIERRGYDNQPAFSPDGRSVWFSSIADDQQSDVYRYDIASRRVTQITRTPQSEYSPTPLPGGGFSCIQVALDGTQRLWRYDDAGNASAPIRADITGVGYHAWLDDETLALFIVAEPVRLEIVDLDGAAPRTVATNIGRSLHKTSQATLAYVQKNADAAAVLIEHDPIDQQDRVRAALPFDGEDLVWLADGSALIANARAVYRLPANSARWEEVGNLTGSVDGDITRMAVSPDGKWLALVVAESAVN